MDYTFEDLKKKTVGDLREIAEKAEDHEALHGHKTMHKEDLLAALCKVFGIEAHEHHEVVGDYKAKIKAQIRGLKVERQAALDAKDGKRLKSIRRRIHRLKRRIHRATV